jgi:hypothetical protein
MDAVFAMQSARSLSWRTALVIDMLRTRRVIPKGTREGRHFRRYFLARDAEPKIDIIMDGCDTFARTVSKFSKSIRWEAASSALGSPP